LSLEPRGLFNVRLLLLIQKNEQQSMNDEQTVKEYRTEKRETE